MPKDAAPTIAQVLSWQPSTLRILAGYLTAQARSAGSVSERLTDVLESIPRDEFAGPIRDEGSYSASRVSSSIRRDSLGLQRLADVLHDSCDAITHAQSRLKDSIEDAHRAGFRVNLETGAVTAGPGITTRAEVVSLAYFQRRLLQSLHDVIEADEEHASIVRAITPALRTKRLEYGPYPVLTNDLPHSESLAAFPHSLPQSTTIDWIPGQPATVFGNVDTAKTVITFVPGTGFRAENLDGQAHRVHALIHGSGEVPEDTAVVVWPYDAPQALTHAASAEYYSDETAKLQNFQAALSERTVGKQVVVGYSFGSTLVAQATKGTGLFADQVMLVGSPGVGPGIVSTKDMTLRRRDGTAYSTEAKEERIGVATSRYDPIRIAAASGIHGRSPSAENFGATTFDLWKPEELPPFESLPPHVSSTLWELRVIEQIRAVGEAHTEHYFGHDDFTQQTRKWFRTN